MKISKLFHWLYAILMLLPFAFFVPSVLYYAFNDNATMQTVEVPKMETISVDFNQMFNRLSSTQSVNYNQNGITAIYDSTEERILINGTATADITIPIYFEANYIKEGNIYLTKNLKSNGLDIFGVYGLNQQLRNTATSNNPYLSITIPSGTTLNNYYYDGYCINLTQMFGSGNEPSISVFNQYFPYVNTDYTESELMQITYDTGTTEQLIENTSIINYAWESIWDLPLFNWCKVSFVSVPFTYITGLFGLAASNSFNYVFTYFASMSIIWLVFDVIMYVPLLVHRWLDKGIVE